MRSSLILLAATLALALPLAGCANTTDPGQRALGGAAIGAGGGAVLGGILGGPRGALTGAVLGGAVGAVGGAATAPHGGSGGSSPRPRPPSNQPYQY
jgi:hypothetical protein